MNFEIRPIGYVRSPYKEKKDAPHQGKLSDTVSEIVIADRYLPGLEDVEKKNHLIVLSWFDRADRTVLRATPPHMILLNTGFLPPGPPTALIRLHSLWLI